MKKTIILTLFAFLLFSGQADAQLSKLKGKLAAKAPKVENVEGDVTGTYTAYEGITVQSGFGTRVAKELTLELNPDSYDVRLTVNKDNTMLLKENRTTSKKLKLRAWRSDHASNKTWLVELEPEVMIQIEDIYSGEYELKGRGEQVADVYVKDTTNFQVWDIETAQAKYDALFSGIKKAEAEKTKANLLEDYDVYKKYKGKAVFASNYGSFNYQYVDKPSDNEEDFIATAKIGDPIFLAAYFEYPVEVECGSDCELDIVYEMGGIEVSRVELRKDRNWQKDIKQLQGGRNTNMFCYNHGHSLWNPRANVMDYAFWYCLHQNRSKFTVGGEYPMKVTFYASRDGNRGAKLAEGTITFEYDAESKKKALNAFEWVRDLAE